MLQQATSMVSQSATETELSVWLATSYEMRIDTPPSTPRKSSQAIWTVAVLVEDRQMDLSLETFAPYALIFAVFAITLYAVNGKDSGGVKSHGPQRRNIWKEAIAAKSFKPLEESLKDICSFESGFVENARGLSLYYHTYTPTGRKSRGYICFIHGFNDHSSWMKEEFVAPFVKDGYTFIAFDNEAHGQSDGLVAFVEDKAHLIDNAIVVFNRLLKGTDPTLPRFLLGVSMGGNLALQVHLKQPDAWTGAVLLCPMVKIADSMKPPAPVVAIMKNILLPLFPRWAVVPSAPLTERLFKLQWRKEQNLKNPLQVPFSKPRLQTAMQMLELCNDMEQKLPQVSLPFIVLHGLADTVTDPVTLFDKAKSKDKTIKLYDGVWHAILHEPEEEYNTAVRDILSWINARAVVKA